MAQPLLTTIHAIPMRMRVLAAEVEARTFATRILHEQPIEDADSTDSGDVCLNNKICLSGGVETIRGTCTDKTWSSADCPQFCQSKAVGPDTHTFQY